MIGREENLMLNGNHRKAEEKHFEVLKNEELATVQGGGMSIFNDINHFFCDFGFWWHNYLSFYDSCYITYIILYILSIIKYGACAIFLHILHIINQCENSNFPFLNDY